MHTLLDDAVKGRHMTAERKGALGDHERRGRKFIPKMASHVKTLDGVRDDAPDFVWVAMIGVLGGDASIRAFVDVQRAALLRNSHRGNRARFDGRLSTLESWSHKDRAKHRAALVKVIEDENLLPDEVLAVLRLYDDLPGAWLLLEPWVDRNVDVDMNDALLLLARAIAEWARGDHLNALTKYLTFCWAALAGGMTWDPDFADHMADFPANYSKRAAAGSMIRAAYSAHRGVLTGKDDPAVDVALRFASRFWNQNWGITSCILEADLAASAANEEEASLVPGAEDDRAPEASPSGVADNEFVIGLVDRCEAQYFRLLDAYFDSPQRDLVGPLPDEVTSGLILRAITGATSLCRAPHQWSSQFSATTLRQLAEIEIVLAWLKAHPQDFAKYRDYGLGHEKLAWLHVDDLVTSLEDIPEELIPVADELEQRKRDAPVLDVTVVSVESTFTGLSLRAMAKDVGLESLYRSVFQVSSSEIHGEWEPVRRENLQRCLNPLHRWHLVPATEPPWVEDPTLPTMVVKMMERLVGIGIGMLARNE